MEIKSTVPTGPAHTDALTTLEAVLRVIGWEVRDLDLDLVAGRAVVELHRADGRWLWLHVDHLGRCHLERWHRTINLGRASYDNSRGPLSPQVNDAFIGRQRCEGARSGLRSLCRYVAENPAPGLPQIPASAVRAAIRPTLSIGLSERAGESASDRPQSDYDNESSRDA